MSRVCRARGQARIGLWLLAGSALAGAVVACSSLQTGNPSIHWTCTALAEQQYFKGYGVTREQAFESAMKYCKSGARNSMACIGNPDKCMPPEGKN